MNLKEDVNLETFTSTRDPVDCTLAIVGGKFLRRFPEVLKKLHGKGWRKGGESFGPEAAVRKNVKI